MPSNILHIPNQPPSSQPPTQEFLEYISHSSHSLPGWMLSVLFSVMLPSSQSPSQKLFFRSSWHLEMTYSASRQISNITTLVSASTSVKWGQGQSCIQSLQLWLRSPQLCIRIICVWVKHRFLVLHPEKESEALGLGPCSVS